MELLQKYFNIALETPDGIKKLRDLILTLAVRGKLVPQDPNDEPANVLLEKIYKGKARLIIKGKIQNQKPLPDIMEHEKLFELPNGWEWFRVGNVFDFQYGKSLPGRSRNESGDIDVYGSNGIVSKHTEFLSNEPCIVIGRKGSAGALNKALRPSWTTDVAYFLIPPLGFDFHYAFIILRSLRLEKLGKGIKPGLNRNEAYKLVGALPPLAEQKRIVAKINQLMLLCDQLELQKNERKQKIIEVHTAAVNRLLTVVDEVSFNSSGQFITRHFSELYSIPENITKLKKSIMQLAVMGKLVSQDPNDQPMGELLKEIESEKKQLIQKGKIRVPEPLPPIKPEEIPHEVPKGWQWVRLGEVTTYGILDKAEPADLAEDTWVLDLEDIEKETSQLLQKIRLTDRRFSSSKNRFMKDDVIYGKLRPYLDKVIVADENGVCTTEMIPLRGYKSITPQYLRLVMKSPYFIRYSTESTHGMNLPRLGTEKARLALFPMVSEREQRRIVNEVDELTKLCDTMERQLNSATTKQTALFDAVLVKV